MPDRCLLDHLDDFTLRRVSIVADRLGVPPEQVAHFAVTHSYIFSSPEQPEPPRFLRAITGGRMADEADQAQAYEMDTLERSLAAVPRYTGESATECELCSNAIPEGRRAAVKGCQTCAPCQDKIDKKARHQR